MTLCEYTKLVGLVTQFGSRGEYWQLLSVLRWYLSEEELRKFRFQAGLVAWDCDLIAHSLCWERLHILLPEVVSIELPKRHYPIFLTPWNGKPMLANRP
jgi:hypothetical protein